MPPRLLDYPWLRCKEHGVQRGVGICKHCAERKAPPILFDPPNDERIGLILCEECVESVREKMIDEVAQVHIDRGNYGMICERHALDWLRRLFEDNDWDDYLRSTRN